MLETAAAKVRPAAQLMNIALKMYGQRQIVNVLIEEEFETILVQFHHTEGQHVNFHLEPTVIEMMNSIDFAKLFLTTAYGFSFPDEVMN